MEFKYRVEYKIVSTYFENDRKLDNTLDEIESMIENGHDIRLLEDWNHIVTIEFNKKSDEFINELDKWVHEAFGTELKSFDVSDNAVKFMYDQSAHKTYHWKYYDISEMIKLMLKYGKIVF